MLLMRRHRRCLVVVGGECIWGLIKLWAPFGPLDYKEYTIIQTPKGPIILINPHMPSCARGYIIIGLLKDFPPFCLVTV